MNTSSGPILDQAWERVGPGLSRFAVPGGWLYSVTGGGQVEFVPDPAEIVRRVGALQQSEPAGERRGPHGGLVVEQELPPEAETLVLAVLVTATRTTDRPGYDMHVSIRPHHAASESGITASLKLVQEALATKGGH